MVRAVKLGGVASGDRMEPSAVATNTQQATYAIPDRTKKASGAVTMVTLDLCFCGLHEWHVLLFVVLICASRY